MELQGSPLHRFFAAAARSCRGPVWFPLCRELRLQRFRD